LVSLISQFEGGLDHLSLASPAVDAASGHRRRSVDISLQVPADTRDACTLLGAMLDRCDEVCRTGRALLTLPAAPEVVALRRWYLGEIVRQIDGLQPSRWPE
jgi:hypothetical protein